MTNITYWTALIAGVEQFFEPDFFPFVLIFLIITAYIVNEGIDTKKQFIGIVLHCISLATCFSATFIFMGSFPRWLESSLTNVVILNQVLFEDIAALLIITVGLLAIILAIFRKLRSIFLKYHFLYICTVSSLMGIAFAIIWTPCIRPILGAILFIASYVQDSNDGIMLLTIYSIGLASLFIIIGISGYFILIYIIRIKSYNRIFTVICGSLLAAIGYIVITGHERFLNPYYLFH